MKPKRIDLTEKKIGHFARGTWVALSGSIVVAEGKTLEEAYEKAVKRGVKKPLVASTEALPATMIL